jgi:hypothetical protein
VLVVLAGYGGQGGYGGGGGECPLREGLLASLLWWGGGCDGGGVRYTPPSFVGLQAIDRCVLALLPASMLLAARRLGDCTMPVTSCFREGCRSWCLWHAGGLGLGRGV